MPVFKYRGYRQNGSAIAGSIEADGHKDAIVKIKSSGIFPKEISETTFSGKKIFYIRKPEALLPDITRNLSTLLYSGVPLIEAIEALSKEQKGQ